MALSTHYVTKQAILEEAGLSSVVLAEQLTGAADGSNRVFVTLHKPLIDRNYDDEVDAYDVTLYVNGVPVTVANVDETSGAITAVTAPANGATVTADYNYSAVSDGFLCQVRDDVEDTIAAEMDAIDPLPYTTVPPTIRKIARVMAAGLLLLRDYGFQADTELTAKDGAAKVKQAEAWLDKYVSIGGSTGLSDAGAATAEAYSEPDIFSHYDSSTGSYVRTDQRFISDLGRDDQC